MSAEGGVGQQVAPPPLPTSIWVLAWSSLAAQVLSLVAQGVRRDDNAISLVVSVGLGALIFGFVSAGVTRARTIRLVLAWVVLVLVLIADVVGLLLADDVRQAAFAMLTLAVTASALAGLAAFHRTDWFAWQRTKPPGNLGAPISHVVAVGVLVGALGGLSGPIDDGPDVRVSAENR